VVSKGAECLAYHAQFVSGNGVWVMK